MPARRFAVEICVLPTWCSRVRIFQLLEYAGPAVLSLKWLMYPELAHFAVVSLVYSSNFAAGVDYTCLSVVWELVCIHLDRAIMW